MLEIRVTLLVVASLFFVCSHSHAQFADTVYTNGKIYTVNSDQAWAEAIAIKNGKLLAVGTNADMEDLKGPETKVIDLAGRFLMPGMVDAHTHGIDSTHPILFTLVLDTTSQENLLASVKEYADANPDKEWIVGGTWPNGMFPGDNPNCRLLDKVVPDRPVFLRDQSGHSVWLNSKAIELAGLDDPQLKLDPRAIVERDQEGKATGTIREFTMGYVRRFMPPTPISEWEESVRQMQVTYHQYGITATRLAGEKLDYLKGVNAVEKDGDLNMHLSMAFVYDHYDSPLSLEQQIQEIEQADRFASELVDPRAIKIFVDGTQLASQAWNVKAYPDDPTNFGTAYYTPEALQRFVLKATAMNRSVVAHACGSRAVREMLNAVEKAKQKYPESQIRHQPTHNIQVEPEDMPRFKELGLAAEISPIMIMNPNLVGALEATIGRNALDNDVWRARELIDAGNTLALATDWNVAPLNPWDNIEYVVTRENDKFPKQGKIAASSAISLAEALRAYTYGGAYAIGKEGEIGTITPGKSADLQILSANPFEIETTKLNDVKVMQTIFRGQVVFDREDAIEALDVIDIQITNQDLDNAMDAAKLNLLVEKDLAGGVNCRCAPGFASAIGPGSNLAPLEVNQAFGTLLQNGYRFARHAREIEWKGDNYWIQWTLKDWETAVLWAYDPESRKAVEVLQVREK